MAGIRQHILPRFLLKGFASRIVGGKVFTHVYRSNQESFETTIENVGVERHFYGRTGELSADEQITRLEGSYASLITDLRTQPAGGLVSDFRIPELISHLSVRTKHIREFFRDSSEYLIDQVAAYLSDFENIRALIFGNPELVKEEFGKFFKDAPIDPSQRDLLWQLVETYLPRMLDDQRSEIEDLARMYMTEMKSILPKAVTDGHIKALAKNPVPQPRVEHYQELNWFVCETAGDLILSDAGCVFEIAEPRRFRPMDDKDDKILGILLPISARRVLVGCKDSAAPTVDSHILNTASARCSREYFVSSEGSEEKMNLARSIGEWSDVLTKEELRNLITEIHAEAIKGGLKSSKEN